MTGTAPLVAQFHQHGCAQPQQQLHSLEPARRDVVHQPRLSGPSTFADNTTQLLTVDPFSGLRRNDGGQFRRERERYHHASQRDACIPTRSFTENAGLGGFADAVVGNTSRSTRVMPRSRRLATTGSSRTNRTRPTPCPRQSWPTTLAVAPASAKACISAPSISANYPGQRRVFLIRCGLAIGGRDELGGRGNRRHQHPLRVYSRHRGGHGCLQCQSHRIWAFCPVRTMARLPARRSSNGPFSIPRSTAIPSGNADAIAVVEATFVDPTGQTTFLIMDDYPLGGLPPEIPPPPGTPDPTPFTVDLRRPRHHFRI